jgi:dihydrolipoamide dehydrogenase
MTYDALVIGAGPGGYVCAIRCGQLGLKTALVEERKLGGVCLNWGCVPTKALYAATRLLHQAESAEEMGIAYASPTIDLAALASWKNGVVDKLGDGISGLLKRAGVEVFAARATVSGPRHVTLSTGEVLEAERIVLATGSSPIEIPGFSFSDPRVWSSDDALALTEVPARLAVIGGGVIGLELANIYRRLGSRVTVIELLPEILATLDLDRRLVSVLKRSLTAQGIEILTGVKADGLAEGNSNGVQLSDGQTVEADRVLVAVGRRPNSGGVGLEAVGIEPDRRGGVPIHDLWETAAPGIYAIGDLVSGPMLAHKASAEGVALADRFSGASIEPIDFDSIPQAIFTDPEIASVGWSEHTAKEKGEAVLVGRFPFAVLGKALGMREPDGFFQVVARESDHRLLGAQVIGAEASDLIAEAAVAVRNGFALEAVTETIHAHPTLPEGFFEACENALGRAIHTQNR